MEIESIGVTWTWLGTERHDVACAAKEVVAAVVCRGEPLDRSMHHTGCGGSVDVVAAVDIGSFDH